MSSHLVFSCLTGPQRPTYFFHSFRSSGSSSSSSVGSEERARPYMGVAARRVFEEVGRRDKEGALCCEAPSPLSVDGMRARRAGKGKRREPAGSDACGAALAEPSVFPVRLLSKCMM